jgi:ParB-like chromosome segregation protein Spo0J
MSAPIPQRAGSNGYAVARNLNPKLVPVSTLKPLGRETRKHPPAQIRKLAESLDRFGFVLPILVDGENRVVAGWGLVLAARKLGVTEVPVVIVSDFNEGISAYCDWPSIAWARIQAGTSMR